MFYIAVTDMMAMLMNGIATGYLAIIGAVFCTHPNLTYILGGYGMSLWGAESTAELILAFNRCMETCSPAIAESMFRGTRAWLWLLAPSLYGLYWFMFTMPHPFSGIYVSWFFNPHVGYIDDPSKTYYNNVHDFHNYVVVTVIMGTYLVFSCLLMMKIYKFKSTSQQSFSQKMIFIQVVLISSINAFASGIYVYMQYTAISKPLIVIAQLSWLFAHGIPSLIYLGLNKTIRKDCINMTVGLISRVSGKSTMGSSSRALTTTNVRTFGRGHASVSTRHGTRVAPTINTTPNVAQQNDEQKF
uniref:Rhodopsin n=1 Tax=Globodera rostochiensis TaxID=31243 RepID=A0A914HK76_GLORO